jgi:ABC-type nitrate/sulfonate/bicarbonate transport system ATPase subunit
LTLSSSKNPIAPRWEEASTSWASLHSDWRAARSVALVGPSGCGKSWRTVEQNVRIAAPRASDSDLAALFAPLGLAVHRDHYPGEPSVGLARRVALARAFAVTPDLLLLDAPFVSLDDKLAARLRDELAELVRRRPVTTLLVTHNVMEAVGLADRILFLSASPARILAEVPVACPRVARGPEQLAALREEIARRINQANP